MNIKLKFFIICVILILNISYFSSVNAQVLDESTTEFLIMELINEIDNNINYGYSRRYASYIINNYLLENLDLIPKLYIHKNELQYIQIEDREFDKIAEYKYQNLNKNVILRDNYYKNLVKPYTYLYLGFAPLVGESEGFFTFHYFIKLNKNKIEEIFENKKTELDNQFTETFVSIDNKSFYWIDNDRETIYELRNIEPYGVFYRKVGLKYLFDFEKDNSKFDFTITKEEYIERLKENLKISTYFNS